MSSAQAMILGQDQEARKSYHEHILGEGAKN